MYTQVRTGVRRYTQVQMCKILRTVEMMVELAKANVFRTVPAAIFRVMNDPDPDPLSPPRP